MPGPLRKYYLFFGLLLVAVVALLGYVLTGASGAKQDVQTSKKLTEIVNKLNSQVDYSTYGSVPNSLSELGLTDVPSTISYTKIDFSQYKLCAKYKERSSSFNGDWTSLLTGAMLAASGQSSDSSPPQSDSSAASDLATFEHTKGNNCQTVKLYKSTPIFPNTPIFPKTPTPQNSPSGL